LGFSDAGAYNERGLVWHEKKRHERAIADFNQALKINPKLASALVHRGIAWRSMGDVDRAIADFSGPSPLTPILARLTTISPWRAATSMNSIRQLPIRLSRASCW
jgi:tetratricopeptide (TPR) repeat protein